MRIECLLKKIEGPRPGGECRDVRYRAETVRGLSYKHSLKHLLEASGLSRSTYCYNIQKKADRYADERKRVKSIHAENKARYGYRRIRDKLRNEGFSINHKIVYRIMKEENLKNVRRGNKYRSYKGDVGKTAPNIINRDFFGIMKSELLYPDEFKDMDHFKQELKTYIEYYNNKRIKIRLKGMSPVQYRTHYAVLS